MKKGRRYRKGYHDGLRRAAQILRDTENERVGFRGPSESQVVRRTLNGIESHLQHRKPWKLTPPEREQHGPQGAFGTMLGADDWD